jgi:hypothetical protein
MADVATKHEQGWKESSTCRQQVAAIGARRGGKGSDVAVWSSAGTLVGMGGEHHMHLGGGNSRRKKWRGRAARGAPER